MERSVILRVDVRWAGFIKPHKSANMGTVDYNSWQESEEGMKLAASLDKDVVLAEGRTPQRQSLSAILTKTFKDTSSTRPIATTWPAWAIGATTRTTKSS